MTLELISESTERADFGMNWEKSLPGNHKAKALSRTELAYVRNRTASFEGEVREEIRVDMPDLLASV